MQLTVLIITYNEEANIARTLENLKWADNILVIDSYSDDRTLDILRAHPCVTVIQRAFDSFAGQCNFGLSQIDTEWTLSIDADYGFPAKAQKLIGDALKSGHNGFDVKFEYCIHGKRVRGSILPDRTILYRTRLARYQNDGHGHRVVIDGGDVSMLPFRICHDDRKPLSRWLSSQMEYARLEAHKICQAEFSSLSFGDRIRRKILIAPWLVFVVVYVAKGGFLSGWRGLFYAAQRFTAELLLSLHLIELNLAKRKPNDGSTGRRN